MKTLWPDSPGHQASQRRAEIYLSAAQTLLTWHRQTTTYVWLSFVLLSCLCDAFHTFKVADLSIGTIVKVLVWGWQAGSTEKCSRARPDVDKDRQTLGEKKMKEQWWISEGWTEDESDEMCGEEGQRMERFEFGNRVSLDANSSPLERLMDRGQHFSTYPGSLPHAVNYQTVN